MRLFGKDLFSFKKEPGPMYDFAQHGLFTNNDRSGYIQFDYALDAIAVNPKGKKKKVEEPVRLTPKGLYEMKSLNNNDFRIQDDPDYLDKQISGIDEKLSFFPPKLKKGKAIRITSDDDLYEHGAVKYARVELASIRERLNNRKRLSEFRNITEKYPHTSTQLIGKVLEVKKYLKCQKADSFYPDFPKEALEAMKEYREFCIKLCEKLPVFYVIADSKDFEQRNKRRDPILLAQSPFGHFWQILGAWDKEMVFLGDL